MSGSMCTKMGRIGGTMTTPTGCAADLLCIKSVLKISIPRKCTSVYVCIPRMEVAISDV